MADTSTDVALSTCATALQEADEVILVLEIKSEFFYHMTRKQRTRLVKSISMTKGSRNHTINFVMSIKL
jgi:hypothetical protein